MLYNIENLLEELNLTKTEKENLIQELRDEFPQDEMLFEPHLTALLFLLLELIMPKR